MYDELVKRLRDAAKISDALAVLLPHSEGNATAKLYNEAADAIEDLEDAIEDLEFACNRYEKDYKALCEYLPKWIPVTEQLPKAERKSYWVCTDTGYQCQCRWTNNLFGMGESDEWSFSIFDIPQYQKVVAWRVLPQPYTPPKEE